MTNTMKKQEVDHMWGILIALLSGALMSIQGVFNTGVTKQTSIWMAAGFVQLTAFAVCVIAWFMTGRESSVGALFRIPDKYMLLGGVMGAFITFTVIKSVAGLGPARANMLILTAQIIVAYVIELFGLFGSEKADFEWKKLIAVGIIVGGIILFKWDSK